MIPYLFYQFLTFSVINMSLDLNSNPLSAKKISNRYFIIFVLAGIDKVITTITLINFFLVLKKHNRLSWSYKCCTNEQDALWK